MWRHNMCLVEYDSTKKTKKYSSRNAFKPMLNLLHINNMEKLGGRLKEVEEELKKLVEQKKNEMIRSKFNSDEFVLSHNRISNFKKLRDDDDNLIPTEFKNDIEIEEKDVELISRSTQTDASSFNYNSRRKKQEV
ncbi:unnamed protein product [Brachionus calyciflorus]|uniref:Uncharacterized protein n=1 Tax=Brachionus calyciflorus TaxID=104777 RepID=A0A814PV62_9BILA|nr:unnamed protein product [Brachionus calyciflorus]